MAQKGKVAGSKKALREKAKKQKRGYRRMEIRKRYLIACEGQETEPNYFAEIKNQLPRDIVVVPKGDGRNTLSLVKWAEQEDNKLKASDQEADEVWIVMDRDSFESHHFDNAIKSAEAKGFELAWSNECFELWVLLHFEEISVSLPREAIYQKLSAIFGFNYVREGKNKNLFQLIREYGGDEELAIQRAERLWLQAKEDHDEGTPYSSTNPATGIHKLVQKLNSHRSVK
ncbi:hypothetical protein LNTAR_16338 [Lentisphaera araneosa HTCC2155]|uniref:Abortive phage resistance protein n=1 Tax=Lentisphaera araneosa HTCC2155 TaxID=313628 RepID=A6DQ82_9BACT|nr:RloB family protein [Lentisphaera araneosa]EDM26133.1 hypothetical protein LNTAR_16338 [Lentisphaera araneosa HTCC2155]